MKLTTKLGQLFVALLIVATTATSAAADWDSFWHGVHVGYARNNAWPDPFNEIDAREVIQPFEIMKVNGWREHTTIGHELFRNGDGALLAAGHKRVQWIATQAPQAHRAIHVLRGSNPSETEARVAAVRSTLTNINVQGPQPQVLVTDVEPNGSSGAVATKLHRERLENLPAPRLPAQSASGQQGITTPSGN
jgi:hypothetical protein